MPSFLLARPLGSRACLLAGALLLMPLFVARAQTLAAPTIDAITTGDGGLTASWSAPSTGAGIVAYDLRYILTASDESQDANWTEIEGVWPPYQLPTPGPLIRVLTGLTNGDQYDVQVRAVATSAGPWSATSTGTPTDHGDTDANFVVLSPNLPLVGSLPPGSSDVDVFRIRLQSNQGYLVYTTGVLDTSANFKQGSIIVNSDDNDKDGRNFLLFDRTRAAGNYFVRVKRSANDADPTSNAPYVIHFQRPATAESLATAEVLDLNATSYVLLKSRAPLGQKYFSVSLAEQTDTSLLLHASQDGVRNGKRRTPGRDYSIARVPAERR